MTHAFSHSSRRFLSAAGDFFRSAAVTLLGAVVLFVNAVVALFYGYALQMPALHSSYIAGISLSIELLFLLDFVRIRRAEVREERAVRGIALEGEEP